MLPAAETERVLGAQQCGQFGDSCIIATTPQASRWGVDSGHLQTAHEKGVVS